MHISNAFAALFAAVFTTVVNASPLASEASASSNLVKRTPGNVYVCPQTGFGGDCAVISAANTCNSLPDWEYKIQSIGPDQGATCYGYSGTSCSGTTWSFTYPGDSTGGWATADPWALAIGSMCCDTTGSGCNGGGSSGGGGGGGSELGPFNGLATYYNPDGGLGACGWAIQNSDFAVAIGAGHWDNGAHCGRTMTVTFNGATVQATVADLCPGCQGDNGIDLTPGAIGAIDPNYVNNGVDSVTWSVV